MPSDPLPLSPAGKAMLEGVVEPFLTQRPIETRNRRNAFRAGILAIEQEARTLARAEVIAEAVAAVEALRVSASRGGSTLPEQYAYQRVLAALSRLGERHV